MAFRVKHKYVVKCKTYVILKIISDRLSVSRSSTQHSLWLVLILAFKSDILLAEKNKTNKKQNTKTLRDAITTISYPNKCEVYKMDAEDLSIDRLP